MPQKPKSRAKSSIAKDVQHIRELMDVQFASAKATLERNSDDIGKMNEILGENTKQLAIHIEGVKQLKETNQLFREEIAIFRQHVQAQVSEINNRMSKVEEPFVWFKLTTSFVEKAFKILKFVGILAAIFGASYGAKLLGLLGH